MTAGWRVETSSRARRDLRRLDPPVRTRVVDAINRLVGDPPIGDVIKLQGRDDEWRLRAGDWRVLMQLDSVRQTVVVLRVLPRGRATASLDQLGELVPRAAAAPGERDHGGGLVMAVVVRHQ